jgi:transposase-like protein
MEQKQEVIKYPRRTSTQSPFDRRLIKEIVHRIEEGLPHQEAMREYGMSRWTLWNWMNQYGSPEYEAARKRFIKPAIKRQVLQAIDSGMSISEARIAYGLKDNGTIRYWIRRRKAENAELWVNLPEVKVSKKQLSTSEQKALEQQLAEAQLKIRALETMIDIAEEQLKIDIRKKSGAKQSPK